MNNPIAAYTRWLHTRWPAGTVEKLPVTGENGITNLPGVRIAGDLSGIPLLKFSSQTATNAVRANETQLGCRSSRHGIAWDEVLLGGIENWIFSSLNLLLRSVYIGNPFLFCV